LSLFLVPCGLNTHPLPLSTGLLLEESGGLSRLKAGMLTAGRSKCRRRAQVSKPRSWTGASRSSGGQQSVRCPNAGAGHGLQGAAASGASAKPGFGLDRPPNCSGQRDLPPSQVAAFIRQFKTVSHAERQALLERTLTRRPKGKLRNWNGWSDKGASGFMSGIDRTLRSLSSCNCRITGHAMRHLKRH
jgi:hypothetical protein